MELRKLNFTVLTFTAAMPFIVGMLLLGAAQTMPSNQGSSPTSGDSTQAKIARAMSAGPADVAKTARIVATDAQGKMVVLRPGKQRLHLHAGKS